MTQRVDFYILDNSDEYSWLFCACRITAKAYQQGLNVYVQVDSEPAAAEFDRLLWSFNAPSFVPHEMVMENIAPTAPVLIGLEPQVDKWDSLLLTLTQEVPANAERFSRVADLILNNEQHKRNGRERFRYYRDLGIEPNTHQIRITT
ncbi:MAG: DNA polymerase III subunit chi [bacterium]